MGNYIKGTDSELEKQGIKSGDILDFANMVFSMEYTGIDFSLFMPKAYGEGRRDIVTHHVMLDGEGRGIIGLIDTYPLELCAGAKSVNAAYVGTVAVHPRHRGRGVFTELMDKVYREALSAHTDLLILDGDRTRYGNFGYEKAGMKYSFNVDYRSVISCCGDDFPVYAFDELDPENTKCDVVERLYGLYQRRFVTARGIEDFLISLLSNKASVYVLTKEGGVAGYMVMGEDGKSVSEFELEDIADIPRFFLDLLEGFDLSCVSVTVGADETAKLEYLEKISSYYNMSQSHQIRILNYEKVIKLMFDWKLKYSALSDGEYVFGIDTPQGVEGYRVLLRSGGVTVERTDMAVCDIYGERELVRIFTTGYFYMGFGLEGRKIPAGWLPLPFFLPDADTF